MSDNTVEYWFDGYEYLSSELGEYEPIVISEQDEGNVYLYEELGVVVKERRSSDRFGTYVCNICVKREFDVGVLVNQYNSKHLVKTLGYYERDGYSYVVTEYVDGITLDKFLKSMEFNEARPVLLQVFNVIKELQELMDFTHYDLHTNNIIVVNESDNHIVKFIDLSRIHVRGVQSSYVEMGLVDEASTPGVFDPLFDYFFFMGIIYNNYGLQNEELDDLFKRNNITTNKLYGYPIIVDNYLGYDLFNHQKVWASTTPGTKTIKEVCEEYAYFKIEYFIDSGMEDYVGKAYDDFYICLESGCALPEHEIEEAADGLRYKKLIKHLESQGDADSGDILYLQGMINHYIRLLGEAAVHDKLLMLERMDDVETVYNIMTRVIEFAVYYD